MTTKNQELLTPPQAADLKGCSRQYIYKLIRSGALDVEEVGGRKLVIENKKFKELEIEGGLNSFSKRIEDLENTLKSWESLVSGLSLDMTRLQETVDTLKAENNQLKRECQKIP